MAGGAAAEGHVFCKLRGNGCAFVEYAPLETAWVPVLGENYLYLYCLWVQGAPKGQGYGRALMERCIADARPKAVRVSVCWARRSRRRGSPTRASHGNSALRRSIRRANTSCWRCALTMRSRRASCPVPNGRRLTKRGSWPISATSARSSRSAWRSCKATARHTASRADFRHVDSLEMAKSLPCVFNNWAVFWNGQLATVNQIDGAGLEKIIGRA